MVNKKGNVLVIILGLAAVLGVAVVTFFFWQSKQSPKSPLTWEECIKIPNAQILFTYPGQCVAPDGRSVTQTLTEEEKKKLVPPDETANWKTYESEQCSIHFKYPNNWTPSMISYSDNQNSYQYNCAIVNSPGNKDNPNFEVLGERISIRRTPVGFEFNTFTLNSFDDYVKVFQNNGFVINDKNQILNDNFPKIRKYFERSNGAAILAFKKDGYFYSVHWETSNKETIILFNQILSTFKFL